MPEQAQRRGQPVDDLLRRRAPRRDEVDAVDALLGIARRRDPQPTLRIEGEGGGVCQPGRIDRSSHAAWPEKAGPDIDEAGGGRVRRARGRGGDRRRRRRRTAARDGEEDRHDHGDMLGGPSSSAQAPTRLQARARRRLGFAHVVLSGGVAIAEMARAFGGLTVLACPSAHDPRHGGRVIRKSRITCPGSCPTAWTWSPRGSTVLLHPEACRRDPVRRITDQPFIPTRADATRQAQPVGRSQRPRGGFEA